MFASEAIQYPKMAASDSVLGCIETVGASRFALLLRPQRAWSYSERGPERGSRCWWSCTESCTNLGSLALVFPDSPA